MGRKLAIGFALLALFPRPGYSFCDGCPDAVVNGQMTHSPWCMCAYHSCQCMAGHATCEEACGQTSGSNATPLQLPAPRNLRDAFMQGMAQGVLNGLTDSLTQPPRPLTPEEIEAQRQAELARQKAEAERRQKIQDYLAREAAKKQAKEASLDTEANGAMAMVDKSKLPVTASASDDELLSKSSGQVPSLCAEELAAMNQDLDHFAREANDEGYQFAADDALSNQRKALGQAGDEMTAGALKKAGLKEYYDDYKVIQARKESVQKEAGYIKEIEACLSTKGCDLLELSKKYSRETADWLKSLSTEGIQQAANRVEKAGAFLQNYSERLEKHNANITSSAAKCLAQ